MNVNKLKKLLAVPSKTYLETPMVCWLLDYFFRKGVVARADRFNNVYVIKSHSDRPLLPCVAAHLDTVQPIRNVHIIEDGGRLIGRYRNKQVGIGADDKTGIYTCLELIDRFSEIAAVFFAMEEHGYQGAMRADPDFFKRIGYVIEFDCPSRRMVSYSCGGERLFEHQGEFITRALPVLRKHGSVHWQRHPYTDVTGLRKRFALSMLNLSSGYYNWHADNEFVKISDVELAIEQGADLIAALDCVRYPCPRRIVDTCDAPVKVGELKVLDP